MKMNLNYYMNGVTYDSGSSLSVQIQYEENGRLLTKTVWREKGIQCPWNHLCAIMPCSQKTMLDGATVPNGGSDISTLPA